MDPRPNSFSFDEEHLTGRIQAYLADGRKLARGVTVILFVCITGGGICGGLAMARHTWSYAPFALFVLIAICAVVVKRFVRNVEQLQRQHGLLCPSCDRPVVKSRWRGVMKLENCERCGVNLPKG